MPKSVASLLLQMQTSAGNGATAALARRMSVQRLISGKEFKKKAGVDRVTTSHILPAIAAQLDALEPWAGQSVGMSAAGLRKTIIQVEHVAENCDIWLKKHDMVKSAGESQLAVHDLKVEADAWASDLRAALAKMTGGQPADFEGGKGEANPIRIKERKKAESVESFLEYFGKLIDVAAPTNGVKAEIEVEVDIPVDMSGVGFIGLRFKAEADRSEAKKLKVRTEAAIAGGAKIVLARIKGEFGGYIESQGETSAEAMRLFSYGLYRLFRESPVMPSDITNFLWGGRTTGGVGYKRAETWATTVEKGIFEKNKDAYVEAGLLGGAQAEIGGPMAKGKIAVAAGGGSRYDLGGLNAIKQAKGKYSDAKINKVAGKIAEAKPIGKSAAMELSNTLAVRDKEMVSGKLIHATVKKYLEDNDKHADWNAGAIAAILKVKGPQEERMGLGEVIPRGEHHDKGERTLWIKGAGEADFGPGTAGLKLESNWITRGRDRRAATHFREAKFELKAGLKIPVTQLVSVGYAAALGLIDGTSSAAQVFRALLTKQEKEAKGNKAARGVGTAAATGTSLATAFGPVFASLADIPAKSMSEGLKSSPWSKAFAEGGSQLAVSTTLMVVVEGKLKPQAADGKYPWELNFSLSEEKALRFEDVARAMSADMVRVGAKQTTRLARFQKKSDGAWQIDFVGNITDNSEELKKKAEAKAKAVSPIAASSTG